MGHNTHTPVLARALFILHTPLFTTQTHTHTHTRLLAHALLISTATSTSCLPPRVLTLCTEALTGQEATTTGVDAAAVSSSQLPEQSQDQSAEQPQGAVPGQGYGAAGYNNGSPGGLGYGFGAHQASMGGAVGFRGGVGGQQLQGYGGGGVYGYPQFPSANMVSSFVVG